MTVPQGAAQPRSGPRHSDRTDDAHGPQVTYRSGGWVALIGPDVAVLADTDPRR